MPLPPCDQHHVADFAPGRTVDPDVNGNVDEVCEVHFLRLKSHKEDLATKHGFPGLLVENQPAAAGLQLKQIIIRVIDVIVVSTIVMSMCDVHASARRSVTVPGRASRPAICRAANDPIRFAARQSPGKAAGLQRDDA